MYTLNNTIGAIATAGGPQSYEECVGKKHLGRILMQLVGKFVASAQDEDVQGDSENNPPGHRRINVRFHLTILARRASAVVSAS